jgi:uncharacterized protein (DUF1330 family)
MSYERLMAMLVKDEKSYSTYREKMFPILQLYGGGFRYDFQIANVLKNDAPHKINRVFAIYAKDKASMDAFFTDPAYKSVREEYFEKSVEAFTLIADYERD